MKNLYFSRCFITSAKLSVLLSVILLFMFTSCIASSGIKGRISEERFYDHNHWYSVKVPKSYQHQMEDFPNETFSNAIFQDPWGNLQRYEVLLFPDKMLEQIDPAKKGELFKDILHGQLNQIKELFKDLKVFNERYLTEHDAYFAVVTIPEGGIFTDIETNKRVDSTRGYLLFTQGDYLIILSNQVIPHLYKKTSNIVVHTYEEVCKIDVRLYDLVLQDLLEMQKHFQIENKSI